MILEDRLHETIVAVGSVMADAHEPWWIISGAAAAIYGAHPITVSDVDVLVSAGDALRIFPRLGIERAAPSDHPRFRSEIFGQWTKSALIVEFMANFKLCEPDGVWRLVRPTTRRQMTVGDTMVYVPELLELRDMFRKFGRAKDRVRIELLNQLR
jgi:hypothetical protein